MKIKILKESKEKTKTPIVKVDVVNSKDARVKYESRMSIELEDKIVYQTLTITETNKRIEGGSKAIEDLERCYPRNISKYPPEIKKIRPWNINGNASKGPNVTIFFGGRTVSAKTLEIDFRIDAIQPLDDQGKPSGSAVRSMDKYSENIFTSNSGAAMRFFNSIRKQIGEYVKNNPWYIYSFFGIETEKEMDDDFDPNRVNKRTKLYLLALRGLQRKAPGEWVITYPYEGDTNSIIFFRCPMGGINEVSSMAGGAVQGFSGSFTEEEEKLIQEMYSSAAIMGSGSGRIPAERSPEGHERYVRMRHDRQGLQNFKPNRYFAENKEKSTKTKIKIRRNLGERCQKGYKTHPTRKTKKMFGKTYRNCVKAEGKNKLEEDNLNSYTNIWKSWKKPADFQKWLLSQVEKLAKYRKGQEKFDFKFFDKVYMDLKDFVEGKYKQFDYRFSKRRDRFVPYRYTPKKIVSGRATNIFYTLIDIELSKIADEIISEVGDDTSYEKEQVLLPWSYEEYRELSSRNYQRNLENARRYIKSFNAENRWIYILKYGRPQMTVRNNIYIADYKIEEIGNHYAWNHGLLELFEQALKDMEKLKKSYPWSKRNFPNIQRHLGIYEGKDPVSDEISKLMKKKGMKQDQAVAIALSMKEKGKLKEADPKKGTGKKPKGSGRRLYTDEDPSDTVSVKFSTVQDIKDTFSKASFKSKSHKRQSQIINLVHQRVRAAYQNAKDPEVKKRLKKAFDYAKKRKEASKRKTQSMKKDKK